MRVLSGIQPTGRLHIGNYLGAIRQWKELQQDHESIFTIVDLHALTVAQDPKTFRSFILQKAAELFASGIDPTKSIMFVQSHVPAHSELAWIFDTLTPVGELERMTQFKDKSQKHAENINVGLLAYPVLMAADILLYHPQAVPVGHDQLQHLELTRIIARKFNATYGETFREPEAYVPEEGARVMSLTDPTKKMSKSDHPSSAIFLSDSPDDIRKKLKSAVTDTGSAITYDPEAKPGISNLLLIYSAFAKTTIEQAQKEFATVSYASFKDAVAELLIAKLAPFAKKYHEILKDEAQLISSLNEGAKKANEIANATMKTVRKRVGLL